MSSEIKVYIVDDEQRAITSLREILTSFFDDVEVLGFSTQVDQAYEEITALKPQLVFLDIEMGQESGFHLLERFGQVWFHVVFVTAFEEFALKAIKFSALDYLIKPASVEDLKAVFRKVQQTSAKEEELKVKYLFSNFLTKDKSEHRITLPVAEGYEFIQVDDIYYIKADGSYAHFIMKSGNRITSSKNLKFFEGILEDYGFYRVHNSTLINLKYIKRITKKAGGQVIMMDGEELGISKSRKDEFLQLLALK
ncbi:MAG: LytTR family DNA-binding domain-containing protein [Bacteroidia bacterium]|nr:LytTR family DNA-binding domain-containing protein [Bacteroidia bacterium]